MNKNNNGFGRAQKIAMNIIKKYDMQRFNLTEQEWEKTQHIETVKWLKEK